MVIVGLLAVKSENYLNAYSSYTADAHYYYNYKGLAFDLELHDLAFKINTAELTI